LRRDSLYELNALALAHLTTTLFGWEQL